MNAAFIPVRGGSKSIPLKNIKEMCGKPLVYWTVAAACGCDNIDVVYVATDSDEICRAAEQFKSEGRVFSKLRVIGRSAESATDTASTESAMLEFAGEYEFDNIVLIQATSPLLTSKDLEQGFEVFGKENIDSVLSVVPQKRFHWAVNADGIASPTNYDVYHRPRRQEFEGYYVENGAFYITSRKKLLASKNRVSGNIAISLMPEETFLEIDEPDDWMVIEQLLQRRLDNNTHRDCRKKDIRMFLTDSDGCLTDGGMYYSENGDEMKKFCAQDGMGFGLLREHGILCGIITGENRGLIERRAKKLQVDILEMGVKDKLSVVKALCERHGISMSQIAYMGDDINDLDVMKQAGLSFSVPNGMKEVRKQADIVTLHRGGDGAVREAIDYVLWGVE